MIAIVKMLNFTHLFYEISIITFKIDTIFILYAFKSPKTLSFENKAFLILLKAGFKTIVL